MEVAALVAIPPLEEGEKLAPGLVDLSLLDPGCNSTFAMQGATTLSAHPFPDWPKPTSSGQSLKP